MSDHKLKPLKNPKKIITIDSGQGATFEKIKDCTFYPTAVQGTYVLSSKHDETLAVVTSGQPFMFEHDGLIWKVPNPAPHAEQFKIDDVRASGSYWNNDPLMPADDSGTFIARGSGGGTGVEDEAHASYAGAK